MQLAGGLLAWMGLLAFGDHRARRWEPKTLRHRLLYVKNTAPWADLFTTAHDHLAGLAPP